jgi:Flp pilus assembly protein TadG
MKLHRRRSRGQSLVEFALVLPLFLLMIMGVVDAGRLVYMNSTLSNAAREGARTGSVEASWMTKSGGACGGVAGQKCPANDAALLSDIRTTANNMNAPFGNVGATYMRCTLIGSVPAAVGTNTTCSPNNLGSGQISVRVTQTWSALTPIIGQIIGIHTLEGSSTFVIN